jgi:methylisocitrate lyase
MEERRLALKRLLDSGRTLVVPGAYDAVSAKLVEAAGFPAVYLGSYATAASVLGEPDIGLATLTELVAHARNIANAVAVPVIADAEDGCAKPPNIWRTVREYEQAGVAAIHIEDHVHGKHTALPRVVRPTEDVIARIRAAIDARSDPNFLIVARTDAPWLSSDPRDSIERMRAFLDAGADLVFPAGMTADRLKAVRAQIPGKVMVTSQRGYSVAQEEEAGADVVLYYGFCLHAAFHGVKAALEEFRTKRDHGRVEAATAPVEAFERMMGYAGFEERARRYGLD